jgi:FolB domain-containing protein
MDEIRIEGLELSCIVGVRRRERRKKQPIRLDLTLGLDAAAAGQTGKIGLTCDYSRVADEVMRLLRFREYRLIEVATEELAAMLFGIHSVLERIEIRLEKPHALHGRARSASVQISRSRSHFARRSIEREQHRFEVLLETHEAGLYLVRVPPGGRVSLRAAVDRRLAWVTGGEVVQDDRVLASGNLVDFVRGVSELVGNRSKEASEIFLCTCPRFPESE